MPKQVESNSKLTESQFFNQVVQHSTSGLTEKVNEILKESEEFKNQEIFEPVEEEKSNLSELIKPELYEPKIITIPDKKLEKMRTKKPTDGSEIASPILTSFNSFLTKV